MPTSIEELKETLQSVLKRIMEIVGQQKRDTLYTTAVSFIGKDASPNDIAPDEVGCAESVCEVVQASFPELDFPTILSTRLLYYNLSNSSGFTLETEPQKGDIVISPTGTGNGALSNGHTGIVGKKISDDGSLWIMSNDSRTGTWEANYTVESWGRYYKMRGGFPVLFFRIQ